MSIRSDGEDERALAIEKKWETASDLDLLRAWLGGESLRWLPERAEDVVRRESSETVRGFVVDMNWLTGELHAEGGRRLDRTSAHEFMRGYHLGMGRGLQIAATAAGHIMNAVQRRGLR